MSKQDAFNRLQEIMDEVSELGKEARDLVNEFFPSESGWCDAYQIFNFTSSSNPYDSTFEKLIENLQRKEDDGLLDEDYSDE